MNCECNDNSNRVKPRIKHVYGNVLRMAIPLTLRTLVKDGDEMIVNDTDFIPSSDHLVRVVFSKGKTNYPITATMDGNVAIIEDKGKIPVGTYDISVECYDDLGNPYRFKQNAVLYVADTTAEAGIDEEIEYEAQTWYLNAAVFLATTEIGEIGDVIDAKLDDVFGNVLYDANAKEIRFYNKGNSRVLATIDSRPFVVDGTVADVYIDVSRQVLVVVLNEDAGGRRFSVPLYLVFNSYYKKDEVDSLVSRKVEGVRFDFSQELPLVVPVTKNGSSISSSIDYGTIDNAIHEGGRLVVACVNNAKFYQLLVVNGMEVVFSHVTALDGYQELLIVNESNVWSMEEVDLGIGGGGGGYEPPVGGIPKSDLASDVQASLDLADSALQSQTQVDWNQTTTTAVDYIKNKPTLATVATTGDYDDLTDKPTIPSKVSDLQNDSGFTTNTGTLTGVTFNGTTASVSSGVAAITATIPSKVSDLQNDSGFTTNTGTLTGVSFNGTSASVSNGVAAITASIPADLGDLANNAGYTKNAGTITGITMNGSSKGTSGVVDLGTVITAHQDISGKANASDVYTKTQTDTLLAGKQNTLTFDNTPTAGSNNPVKSGGIKTAIDQVTPTIDENGKWVIGGVTTDKDAQGPRGNTVLVNENAVGIQGLIVNNVVDGGETDILSAEMGKVIRKNIVRIFNALGNYAFPDGKPVIDWGDDTPVTYTVSKTIGTGLSATGGDADVALGDSLEVTITITDNLYIIDDDNVVVTMGGQPVAGAWNASTMKVTIGTVTGNVVINVPSLTYVQRGLVLHLDGKNGRSVAHRWDSLVSYNNNPLYFKLENCDEQSYYVAGNGTSSKGTAFSNSALTTAVTLLDIAANAGTIEAAYKNAELNNDTLAIMHNGLGSGNRICLTSWKPSYATEGNIYIMHSTAPGSDFPANGDTCAGSIAISSLLAGGSVSLKTSSVKYNGTECNPKNATNQNTDSDSRLSIFWRKTSANERFFKLNLYALRVYSVQLTDDERAQNLAIDQKRFNL